jgi:thioredoxin reductase (NADPH)
MVVGGSAAGLSAALYTARQGLKTLVITKDVGGQMLLTNNIENYPGFEHIGGFELANRFKEQAELYGTEFLYEEVTSLEEEAEGPSLGFKAKTIAGEYQATAVILGFGKTPIDLGVPGEEEFKGRGVSYCAVCDGPLFKGKKVSVAGSGDQALEAVNYLSNVAEEIYLIHKHDKPIGTEELVNQILALPNLKSVPNSRVKELLGGTRLVKVVVVGTKSEKIREIASDAIFIEIGYIAKTGFLRNLVKLTAKNEVETDKDGHTSHPGIFAAGDVTDTPFKQAVVSAGQGCAAALSAYNYVQRLRGKTAARTDWRSIKPVAR